MEKTIDLSLIKNSLSGAPQKPECDAPGGPWFSLHGAILRDFWTQSDHHTYQKLTNLKWPNFMSVNPEQYRKVEKTQKTGYIPIFFF